MATFTPTEVTSLARMFSTTSDLMGNWLGIREGIITATDLAAIQADITAYELIDDNAESIEPNIRNFGVRLNADAPRALIRNRVAGLIGWEVASSGSRLIRS